jgi:imidazolonepropionase-like amidohydrolase
MWLRVLLSAAIIVSAGGGGIAEAQPTLILGGTVLTGTGKTLPEHDVLLRDGKIAEIGRGLTAPAGAIIIAARGKFVTPGLVETHSHLGVYPYPRSSGHADGNELTAPVTAHVRAKDAILASDPAIRRAWEGGVTTVQVLPGSGNCIGGESAVVKLRGGTVEDMLFAGAPRGIKMAMGENPKRVYGSRGKMPMTRMGSAAVMREAFAKAQDLIQARERWEKGGKKDPPPDRDLVSETLADVIQGKIRVHVHSYLPQDFLALFRIADEFGFKIASLQHGLEAHKIAEEIRRRGIGVAILADVWGQKHEMYNGRPDNAALLTHAGVRVAIHTDHPVIEQRWLIHEAAKTVRHGMSEAEALAAVTLNPAWMLGLDGRVGSVEVGKDADVVVWSEHPFHIGAKVDALFIDGKLVRGRP